MVVKSNLTGGNLVIAIHSLSLHSCSECVPYQSFAFSCVSLPRATDTSHLKNSTRSGQQMAGRIMKTSIIGQHIRGNRIHQTASRCRFKMVTGIQPPMFFSCIPPPTREGRLMELQTLRLTRRGSMPKRIIQPFFSRRACSMSSPASLLPDIARVISGIFFRRIKKPR